MRPIITLQVLKFIRYALEKQLSVILNRRMALSVILLFRGDVSLLEMKISDVSLGIILILIWFMKNTQNSRNIARRLKVSWKMR